MIDSAISHIAGELNQFLKRSFELDEDIVVTSATSVRRFHFNRPFLIYVKKREPAAAPFFVMWVDNAELMHEFVPGN